MDVKISDSWKPYLQEEIDKPYFKELISLVDSEYKNYTCYPESTEIFKAFNTCHFKAIRVVIIGQDPYHGENQANGLCFSVHNGVTHPPSLRNIFKELETDVNKPYPESGDLLHWAQQGVLMLNATLTVRAHEAGSHQKIGWEIFTDAVIKIINAKQKDVIFLLWGGYAKKKAKLIDTNKHTILTSGHPSPLSANRGYWFGNKHFSQVNGILKGKNQLPITW